MNYTLIIEKSQGGKLIGSVVELPGCYTQADTIETLIENIKEAIGLYLETEKPERLTEFMGIQRLSI